MILILVVTNLSALLLVAAWAYLNGVPDWTTQTGAFVIGTTLAYTLNLGYFLFTKSTRLLKVQTSIGYENAIMAIEGSRLASTDALRHSSVEVLAQLVGTDVELSKDHLIEAAAVFQQRGEYTQVLQSLSSDPVAYEIMYLAGEGKAAQNVDAMIRLQGLVAFLHAWDTPPGVVEYMEGHETRLDELYAETSFEFEPDGQSAQMSPPMSHSPQQHLDYQDVVNATLRIFPIEKISSLPLAQRRALFSRMRDVMEDGNGLLDPNEMKEIEAWIVAHAQ